MSYLLLSTISGQKIGALSYTDGDTLPNHFANGLPYESDGTLAVSVDGAISHYHQGLPFTASGRLAGTLSETPTRFGGGAAPFSASGHLTLGSGGVTHYSGGICYTESGSIGSSAGGPPLSQRYFTQLDGQSKYWRRIEPDYGQTTTATLECLFYGGIGSGFQLLTGRHSDDRFYIGINSGNSVVFGNGTATSGSTTVDRTKINHAKLTADGTNVTFYVNGVQISQVAQTWSGLLDQVGFGAKDAGTANFYDGILVSSRVTTDTEDDIYPLDKNLPYELPDGVTLTELWDGTPTVGAGWIDNGDGSYTCDGTTGALLSKVIPATINSGDEVEVTYEVSNYVSGGVRSLTYGTSDVAIGSVSSTNGVFTQIVTINSNTGSPPNQAALQSYPNFIGTVSNISFKALPDSALIFENGSIDGSDRLLVDPTGTGFDGQDEWADAIKTLTGEATAPTPSSILINETGVTLSGVSIPARVGVILRVSGDADITSGQIDLSVNSNMTGVAASITASGTFTFDLDSNGFIGFKRAFTGGAVAELTNLKVIAIYDYATGANPSTYSSEYSDEYA